MASANDPVSQVLLGILANGLYDVGREAFRPSKEAVDPFALDPSHRSALQAAIEGAVEKLTEVEQIRDDLGGERLREFFRSPEMEQFGRQAFAVQMSDELVPPHGRHHDGTSNDWRVLRRGFIQSLQLWTGLDDAQAEEHGDRLFNVFIGACDQALEELVQQGVLQAHETRSAMRSARVLAEIDNLSKNLRLQRRQGLDIPAINDFEERYRSQVVDRETNISLPSLDRRVEVRVDEIFVTPTLQLTPDSEPNLGYADIFPLALATIILGDPGGGKSTLMSKVVQDVSSGSTGRVKTPIVIRLREYAAQKARTGCSLVRFIEARATSKYQMESVPEGAFEYLLRNGRVVVLLDGLDELLETSARREISGDVESFRKIYPTAPVVVTSRKVGYDEAPLSSSDFSLFELTDLSERQTAVYADRMLKINGVSDSDRPKRLADFMSKSGLLEDLRGNPLLLGLLLERYAKTLNLPAHRVAVIESCALLLFDRWDRDREIFVKFPFESKLRPVVSNLAHMIYHDVELQQGVTERWLIDQTAAYFVGRKYEDVTEAAGEAREFVGLCNGRIWVFSEVGANAVGDKLFRFTHRTFLEYFVAVHLRRLYPTPADLLQVLKPRVESQEWDEVCLQAVHMLGSSQEAGSDQILMGLIPEQANGRAEINCVSFCTRSLSSVVPDRLETIDAFLKAWMEALKVAMARQSSDGPRSRMPVLLNALVNSHPENQETLSRGFSRAFDEVLGTPERRVSRALVLDFALNLARLLRPHSGEPARELWMSASEEVASNYATEIRDYGRQLFSIAFCGLFYGAMSLADFVSAHGLGGLLAGRAPGAMSARSAVRVRIPSLAELILEAAVRPSGAGLSCLREREWAYEMLDELGDFLPKAIPAAGETDARWRVPTVGLSERREFPQWLAEPASGEAASEMSPKQLGAAAILLAALDEQSPGEPPDDVKDPDCPGLLALGAPFLARRNYDSPLFQTQPRERLSPAIDAILCDWADGKLTFTR